MSDKARSESGGVGWTPELEFVEDHYSAMDHTSCSLTVSSASLQFGESWTAPAPPVSQFVRSQ